MSSVTLPAPKHTLTLNMGIFLALSVPFLLIIGRAASDIAMILVSLLFLGQSAMNRDWRWIRTPWFVTAVAACLFMLVSGSLAEYNPTKALKSGLLWLRFPIFTMAFSTWILADSKARRYLLPMLAILLAASSIDTIVQFVTGTSLTGHGLPTEPGRLTGPFKERMLIGTFIARLVFPALGLGMFYAYHQTDKKKYLFATFLLFALTGITILLTGERAAFLLFGLSTLVFVASSHNMRKTLLPAFAAIGVILVITAFSVPVLRERLITKTIPIVANFSNSPYGVVWHNAFVAWKSSPVFGTGLNNFVPMCKAVGFKGGFRNELAEWTELHCVRHAHNPYLEWLSELGVIGLAFFLGLIGTWWKQIKDNMVRFKDNMGLYYAHLGFAVGLIPFLWPLIPSLSFFSNWSASLFWWVLGLALSIRKENSYTNA